MHRLTTEPASDWIAATITRANRVSRTSRCYRERPLSVTTTAIWSAQSSVSPIICRRQLGTYAAPTFVEDPRESGRARERRDRAADRLREQRPARHHARGRRAHVRQALRRATRLARRGLHQQRQRVRRRARAAGCRRRRSRRSSMRAHRRRSTARCSRKRVRRLTLLANAVIVAAHGTQHVTAVDVAPLAGGATRTASSAICVACPAAGTRPSICFRRRAASCATTMRSRRSFPMLRRCRSLPAGAANGCFDLAAALTEGHAAGVAAVELRRSASVCARSHRVQHHIATIAFAAAVVCARAQQVRTSASSICKTM